MGRGAGWAAVYGVAESDATERLQFHFSLSCTGAGTGKPGGLPSMGSQSRTRLSDLAAAAAL